METPIISIDSRTNITALVLTLISIATMSYIHFHTTPEITMQAVQLFHYSIPPITEPPEYKA